MSTSEPGPVRVLIVDDSALMRRLLTDILRSSPAIEVVGAARDGTEALELNTRLCPDVVTLDVQMPGLSGLEVLPLLLQDRPVPVVMVSSLTQVGADVTFAALELGAVDFMAKPAGTRVADLKASGEILVAKILAAARSRVRNPLPSQTLTLTKRKPPASRAPRPRQPGLMYVVIGISTGGPQALGETLPRLTPPIPPVLIVQHMPAQFTEMFAQRLNRTCSVAVKEAEQGDPIRPDQILIAPGGRHMVVAGQLDQPSVSLTDGPLVSGHRPSVDMLFQSAARLFGAATVGFIMTGMGRDGVEGCKRILAAGGTTFGQDEATSVVYGMNKAAMIEGAVRTQFPLEALPSLIEKWHERDAGSP